MKQQLIQNITQGMLRFLNHSPLIQLQKVLDYEFARVKIYEVEQSQEEVEQDNTKLIESYNIRRILSSYFSWLEDEDYILKSPVRRIHKVKAAKIIKESYTDEVLEQIRDSCENLRDLALIDML